MIDWRVVPLERWPGELTAERQGHRFRVSRQHTYRHYDGTVTYGTRSDSGVDWVKTVDLLERELGELIARDVVLQMAVGYLDIRNDGWIRANARPAHPGVILSFESKHGPLSYAVDTFDDWQANVRGIAKALEALRMVDRYGVTKSGEQYKGWRRIAAQSVAGPEVVLAEAAGITREEVRRDVKAAYRMAAKKTHPDAGGSHDAFVAVTEAARLVGAL